MGTQLDSDKSASTVTYKNAITEIGTLLLSRLTRVWLHNEFLFRKFPIGRQFEKCLHTVHAFADNVITERKKTWKAGEPTVIDELGMKKRPAMLDLLLEAESKGEIDLEGIREEVNTFMFEVLVNIITITLIIFLAFILFYLGLALNFAFLRG